MRGQLAPKLLASAASVHPAGPRLRLGISPSSQATTWPELRATARLVDRLGYDHLWGLDHLYATFGDPHQPMFEGWILLAAYAMTTKRVRLGHLVGANAFRNPGLVAKMATTLDHISGGRAILGLGGGWFELEHLAHGIDFGSSPGQRLDWLDEAVGMIRGVLDGEEVTHAGQRYRADKLRHSPLPLQTRLPILIGGSGEKKTLRTVARYADYWNAEGPPELLAQKDEVLRRHCANVGRDESEIERTVVCKMVIRNTVAEARSVWEKLVAHNRPRPDERDRNPWLGSSEEIAARMRGYVGIGFRTLIVELLAPHDVETIERLIGEVRPLVEA
jgi:alkanesulfonate monooxygenase SsuD/methylene tetrahydromethanopterin reductase-like flavin-dependent oxidoreductase (luciferase family)